MGHVLYGADRVVLKDVKRKPGGYNTVPLILSGPPACLSAAMEQEPSGIIVL